MIIVFEDYKISDLFDLKSSIKKINANTIEFNGKYPYVARTSNNNGIRGYINYDEKYLNKAKPFHSVKIQQQFFIKKILILLVIKLRY